MTPAGIGVTGTRRGWMIALLLACSCTSREHTSRVLVHDSIVVASRAVLVRRFAPLGAWDTLMRFSQVRDGTERPDRIALSGNLVVFFSERSKQLVAVEPGGRARWRLGPVLPSGDSLRRVEELRVMRDGRIATLDSRSGRLVIVRPDGVVDSELNLTSLGHLTDVVELGPDRLLLLASDTSAPFAVISGHGRMLQHLKFPDPAYAKLHTLARAGALGSGSNGTWVFGFRLGNGLVAFRDTTPLGPIGSYPEPVPFPTVIEESTNNSRIARLGRITRTAAAITIANDHAFVLFGGTSPERGRIIDVYRLPGASYAYSLLLPSKAVQIISTAGNLFALMGGTDRVLLRMRDKAVLRVADR